MTDTSNPSVRDDVLGEPCEQALYLEVGNGTAAAAASASVDGYVFRH